MKPLLLILLLACTASARPFHSKPVPKPVAPVKEAPLAVPAQPEAPKLETARFTVNPDGSVTRSRQADAELRDWIEGIQRENALNGQRADAAETSEKGVRASLTEATANVESLNGQIVNLTKDRNAQAEAKDTALKAADYWHQKDSEAVAKLWWWRCWGWLTGILGILILVGAIVVKFTAWGANTAAPILAGIAKV